MKFWTVQKKEIIEMVKKNGSFQPDFSKSDYLQLDPNLKDLYYMVLDAFNKKNNMNLPGLIYAFMWSDDKKIYQIENIEAFYAFIQNGQSAIKSLWNTLNKKDVVIVELNYEEEFNPIYVDINDFQFLMPPIMILPPYNRDDIDRISMEISKGEITRSILPSNIIQAHLPYIKSENIVNVYSMFELS